MQLCTSNLLVQTHLDTKILAKLRSGAMIAYTSDLIVIAEAS